MKISVLIVEDDPITSLDLKEQLTENGIEVLATASSGEQALKDIHEYDPDVLLVDIRLNGKMTGIDLINQLENPVPFIFISANSDRVTVDQAILTKPSAFITKPFDEREVMIAIELAFNNHNKTTRQADNKPIEYIFLKSGNRFEKVLISDIDYVKADGSYCRVVTKHKEYVLTENLNNFCQNLGNSTFARIHRSYAVNTNNVTGLDNDYVFIGEKSLPIARSNRSEIRQMFRRFA
jgi:DNA-binding LytR/AlgR family response regulator